MSNIICYKHPKDFYNCVSNQFYITFDLTTQTIHVSQYSYGTHTCAEHDYLVWSYDDYDSYDFWDISDYITETLHEHAKNILEKYKNGLTGLQDEWVKYCDDMILSLYPVDDDEV